MHWKHPSRPGVTLLARANLIYLEVVDTPSDTLSRGHSRLSADGIAVPMPGLEYDTDIGGHGRTHPGRTQEPRDLGSVERLPITNPAQVTFQGCQVSSP